MSGTDGDPRKSGDWKIQKKRGFQKDRDDKRTEKMSKTSKRNSKEPMFDTPYVFLQEDADGKSGFPALPKSRSPVKGLAAFTLTDIPTAASVTAALILATHTRNSPGTRSNSDHIDHARSSTCSRVAKPRSTTTQTTATITRAFHSTFGSARHFSSR